MIVIFIAAFFCVLNICLWCTFFLKFRKLFSTEDIIASTHEQIEEMINELNFNASRDIDIIEDRIKQLKAAVAEADRHVELSRKELEAQKANFNYYKKIESVQRPSVPPVAPTTPVEGAARYLRNQGTDFSSGFQTSKSYELTAQGKAQVTDNKPLANEHASDLFEASGQIVSKTGTTFTVEDNGTSYTNIPVLGGNVRYADDPIRPEKSVNQMIRDLNAAGHSTEEIASELNRSITEVEMVLTMKR